MSQPIPEYTQVLIVGAGPTGLACALSLHANGCRDVTIVDAVESGQNTSRAIVIHSATLEALDAVGCPRPVVEAGSKHTTFSVSDGSKLFTLADWDLLRSDSKYPFLLIIPQSITESILEEQVRSVGITIFRPLLAVGATSDPHDPSCTNVVFNSGCTIKTRYLVGADGARSMVRQTAGINFKDPINSQSSPQSLNQMVLADVIFAHPLPSRYDNPVLHFASNNVLLVIPLPPPSNREVPRSYRIAFGIPESMGVPPPSPPKEYLEGSLEELGLGISTEAGERHLVDQVLWSSRFRTHCSIADTFFRRLPSGGSDTGGVALLVGDAAHIHSPTGGQGMNLGLRDAITLGSVLAPLTYGDSPTQPSESQVRDLVLQTWAQSRYQQGLKVIKLSQTALWLGSLPHGLTWVWGIMPINLAVVRSCFLWVTNMSTWIRKQVTWRLSGLGNR